VILAHTHIPVGIVDGAPLADDNVSGLYDLAAELLQTQTFAM
jgi:hypothetical protein